MQFRHGYSTDQDQVSKATALKCPEQTLTQQHQKDEADINTIVRKFGLTGQLPQDLRVPQYGDFTGISDYQTALNAVMQANESFLQLPAKIREKFHNDPEQFVNFCLDEKNRKEAEELGLVLAKKEPVPEGGVSPTGEAGKTTPVAAQPAA